MKVMAITRILDMDAFIKDAETDSSFHIFEKISDTIFKINKMAVSDSKKAVKLDEMLVNIDGYEKNQLYGVIETLTRFCAVVNEINTNITDDKYWFEFFVPQGTDECLVFIKCPVYLVNTVSEELKTGYSGVNGLISDIYPYYEKQWRINERRAGLNLLLYPNRSLAYVDAQLDFITKIVLDIVENDPEIKKRVAAAIAKYDAFKDATEQTSIFKIKDEQKCIDEITENKRFVRAHQKAFYDERERILRG